MGLSNFYKLLKKKGYTGDDVYSFKGSTIAVDARNLCYRYAYGVELGGDVAAGVVDSITRCVKKLVDVHGASRVILVFDSNTSASTPKAKKETLAKRSKSRKRQRENLEIKLESHKRQKTTSIEDDDKIDRMHRACRGMSREDYTSIINALRQQEEEESDGGISRMTVFVACGEADNALCWLSENNVSDYTVSDDADLLISGCSNVVRNMTSFLYSGDPAKVFSATKVRDVVELKDEVEMLQFGCLLSCDYCPGIRNVGPVAALKGIKAHSTVSAFIDAWNEKQRMRFKFPESHACKDTYCDVVKVAIKTFKARPDAQRLKSLFCTK
jgi:5'-3' exonuclease